MKKSKVIIPAMAMILFSTAASISGTVAWFTASRVFNTQISNFQVKNIDGNLSATMEPIVGTEGNTVVTEGHYKSITVPNTSFLVDGSFNHTVSGAAGVAYRLNRDEAGYKSYGAANDAEVAANWLYKEIEVDEETTNQYFIALQWSITFTYSFGTESQPVDLFFDVKNSVMTGGNENQSKSLNTQKGFRIAFIGGSKNVVWGDLADPTSKATDDKGTDDVEDDTQDWTYVKGTADEAASIGKYTHVADVTTATSGDFFSSTTTEATLASDETSATSTANDTRTNKIATFAVPASPATASTVTIRCVAWFEGTDPNVVNDSNMQSCSAAMSFYARTAYSGS